MKDCRSREDIREAIIRVLRGAAQPLTSEEVFEKLDEVCGERVDRFTARMVLATLVRERVVERLRGDETRGIPRHVYRLAASHQQPP